MTLEIPSSMSTKQCIEILLQLHKNSSVEFDSFIRDMKHYS